MFTKTRIAVTGGALAASCLLAGTTAGCESAPPPSSATAEWQQPFDAIQYSWKVTRGLGNLGVRLRIIQLGERQVCEDVVYTTYSGSVGDYCPDDNTVYISAQAYKLLENIYVSEGGNARKLKLLFLGHEEGHAVQYKFKNMMDPPSNDPKLNMKHEQQADCLDGELIANLGGISLDDAKLMYHVFKQLEPKNVVDDHGSPKDRYGAFERGEIEGYELKLGCGLRLNTSYPDGRVVVGV